MNYRTKAIYRGGAFVPETRCDLPEDAEVDLLVQGSFAHAAGYRGSRATSPRITADYGTHETESPPCSSSAVYSGRVA